MTQAGPSTASNAPAVPPRPGLLRRLVPAPLLSLLLASVGAIAVSACAPKACIMAVCRCST